MGQVAGGIFSVPGLFFTLARSGGGDAGDACQSAPQGRCPDIGG